MPIKSTEVGAWKFVIKNTDTTSSGMHCETESEPAVRSLTLLFYIYITLIITHQWTRLSLLHHSATGRAADLTHAIRDRAGSHPWIVLTVHALQHLFMGVTVRSASGLALGQHGLARWHPVVATSPQRPTVHGCGVLSQQAKYHNVHMYSWGTAQPSLIKK
jgi:hypothetical protein